MRILIVSLCFLWLPLIEANTSTVDIRILFDMTGEPIEHVSVNLFERGSRKDFTSHVVASGNRRVARDMPYGQYTLQVAGGGWHSHEQTVLVYQPTVSVRVFLRIGRLADETLNEVVGSVTPRPPKGHQLWVKMLPLLRNESVGEAEVEQDGSFRLTGLDRGQYVLVVMGDTQAVYMKQVTVGGRLALEVRLPASVK